MNTELKNAVLATDLKAQYDACAKKLLGYKDILAQILIGAVEEFQRMSPEEVKPLIEDDIHIGKVPIDPGLTNAVVRVDEDGKEIIGMNTVNEEVNAGYILVDIIFYVHLKEGRSKIIINVEAKRKEPTEYDIINRAIFYVSREISSQKNREFVNSNYNDIKKGKQLKFRRVSRGKLERFRSFVRSRGTETSLFSKNANLQLTRGESCGIIIDVAGNARHTTMDMRP